jgi:hypothetical protein
MRTDADAELVELAFPRHVHQWGGLYLQVNSATECAAAMAQGWALLPPQTPPAETTPEPAEPDPPIRRGGRPVRP